MLADDKSALFDLSKQADEYRIMGIRSDLLKTVKVVKSSGTSYNRSVQHLLLRYLSGASAECRFAFLYFCLETNNPNASRVSASGIPLQSFVLPFVHFFYCRPALREPTQGVLTCRSAPAGGVFIAVVPTVVVTVAGPVVRDAAAAGALELGVGAGPGAPHFVAAVPAVVICNHAGRAVKSSRFPGGCHGELRFAERGGRRHLSHSATAR